MKKIVFFVEYFNHDGISNQIEILSKSLIDLYKIEIVCFKNYKKFKNKKIEITEINIDNNRLNKLMPGLLSKQIKKYIETKVADIFIVVDSFFVNYISKKEFNSTNLIYWMHSFDIDKKILNKIKDYDSVVVPSNCLKDKVDSALNNVIIIPNAIVLPNKTKSYDKTNKIVTVSKLVNDKNISDLIYVVREIVNKGVDISFNIIGDGPERNNLINLIKNEKLGKNINMLGFYEHDDILTELMESDIFLFASNKETFGISVLEAMSVGLPVVCFDDDAIGEIINDDIDGFIIKNRLYEDMTDKVIMLLDNVEMQENIGLCAIEKSRNYDVYVIKREWLKILK